MSIAARISPVRILGIVNCTPDSFWAESRAADAADAAARARSMWSAGADLVDLGAVSTRPGAEPVELEEEWRRLELVLRLLAPDNAGPRPRLSIDTTRAEIIRRACDLAGPVWINDISAGEDDPEMLPLAATRGLGYIAMHKRGRPDTMDTLCTYPEGVVHAVAGYFDGFARRAAECGLHEWILDPGFGFAKTEAQNYELLFGLEALKRFGRPILAAVADKRFTHAADRYLPPSKEGISATERIHEAALRSGATLLRVHDVAAAVRTVRRCTPIR